MHVTNREKCKIVGNMIFIWVKFISRKISRYSASPKLDTGKHRPRMKKNHKGIPQPKTGSMILRSYRIKDWSKDSSILRQYLLLEETS